MLMNIVLFLILAYKDDLFNTLYTLYSNSDPSIVEEVINTINNMYRPLLKYLINHTNERSTWNAINMIIDNIFESFPTMSNKLRKKIIKLVRTLVLCFSYPSDNRVL